MVRKFICLPSFPGHEHPRRHHHGLPRSGRFEAPFRDWEAMAVPSSFESEEPSLHATSLNAQGHDWARRDHSGAVPTYGRESHSFDAVGNAHHSKSVNKESSKDFKNMPKGSLLTSSLSFVNESNDRGSLTYSGRSTFESEKNKKEYPQNNHVTERWVEI